MPDDTKLKNDDKTTNKKTRHLAQKKTKDKKHLSTHTNTKTTNNNYILMNEGRGFRPSFMKM